MRRVRSRLTSWPTSWAGSAGSSGMGVGASRTFGSRAPRAGAPGCAWTPPPTAARVSPLPQPELVTDLACAQVPDGMLDGLDEARWPPARNCMLRSTTTVADTSCSPARDRQARRATQVVEGAYEAVQRVGGRVWRVPVTAFWQAHRDAARVYSGLVAEWARARGGHDRVGLVRWRRSFRGGARRSGRRSRARVTVDTSRGPRGRPGRRWRTWVRSRWSPNRCAVR